MTEKNTQKTDLQVSNAETAKNTMPKEEVITAEELAVLKEKFINFTNDAQAIQEKIKAMVESLAAREEDTVLKSWPLLKDHLEMLNATALQLNKGDFKESVQKQLEELLSDFSHLQNLVIAYEPEESRVAKAQKAQNAYEQRSH